MDFNVTYSEVNISIHYHPKFISTLVWNIKELKINLTMRNYI